ncbi:MAG: DUF2851 family protein [Bacteroidia bacterium]
MVKESLIHFIWQNKLLNADRLFTTKNEPIGIKSVGIHNHDAGPDFKNAQIQIGEQLWAGHVEIHVNTSDWLKHGHQNDENYKNVILHVVLFNDIELDMPTIELNGKIQKSILNSYENLMKSQSWIACAPKITEIEEFTISQFKSRLIVERLELKIESIKKDLDQTNNDWDEVFYRNLLRYAGLKVNKTGFEALAEKLPYKLIAKYSTNIIQIEALLFGVAGFLNEINDSYQKQLQTEYLFLKHKHKLSELSKNLWQFATLRPANFPTVRLAQLATLFYSKKLAFSQISRNSATELCNEILNTTASEYWDKHYHFGKISKVLRKKKIGKTYTNLLIINHYAPIIYAYGWYKGSFELKEKAIELLQNTKSENNNIIKNWLALGVNSESALDSQALIHLKTKYCDLKKCLNCSIGIKLLRKQNYEH